MRNLKKILALVLALVMSFSLMATANAFTDSEKVTDTYETAVTVLDGLKVFQGYDDGSFQPQGSITRAEVAAIIYRIVTGDVTDTQVGIYADYNKFDDVKSTSWYAGYVNFCANAEYIKGYDAKTFGPNDPVTGYQALAMILRALGYDKNGEFTGTSWQVQTAAVGENRGITKNISAGTLGTAASREVVAEILFRAILVDKVNYTPAFGYQLDDTSLGWDTFELEEITGVVIANEYADLYSTSPLKAGKTELDVDGESYTVNYSTELTDIGEARDAYITKGETVLYIADAGNTVFETGAATDIEKDKDFEKATGLERDEDTTEYFINFDGGAEYKASDWKIEYVVYFSSLTAAEEAELNANGSTGKLNNLTYTKTIRPDSVITDLDMDLMKAIFYTGDRYATDAGDVVVKGEIYVGTQSKVDISDDPDMSWKAFQNKYIDTAENVVDFDETDNGEWLKVIDNDGDGVADYVLLTEFAMSVINRISKDNEYTLADLADDRDDKVMFNDIAKIDGDDIITEDELAEDDVVIYTLIDGKYYMNIAEKVTETIDKKGINSKTETITCDGTDYVQSHIGYTDETNYLWDVTDAHTEETYDLYLDHFGYVRLFIESEYNTYMLLTDGWYEDDNRTETFKATYWNVEAAEEQDIDVVDNDYASKFIADRNPTGWNGDVETWGRLYGADVTYLWAYDWRNEYATNIAGYSETADGYALKTVGDSTSREDYMVQAFDTDFDTDKLKDRYLEATTGNNDIQTTTNTQYYLVIRSQDNRTVSGWTVDDVITWTGYKNAPAEAELNYEDGPVVGYAVTHPTKTDGGYNVADVVVFETLAYNDSDTYFVYEFNNWDNWAGQRVEHVWGVGYNDEGVIDSENKLDVEPEDNKIWANGVIEFYEIYDDGDVDYIGSNYAASDIYAGIVDTGWDIEDVDYIQVNGTAAGKLYVEDDEGVDVYKLTQDSKGVYDVEVMDRDDVNPGDAMILFTDGSKDNNVEYAIWVGPAVMLHDITDCVATGEFTALNSLWGRIVADAHSLSRPALTVNDTLLTHATVGTLSYDPNYDASGAIVSWDCTFTLIADAGYKLNATNIEAHSFLTVANNGTVAMVQDGDDVDVTVSGLTAANTLVITDAGAQLQTRNVTVANDTGDHAVTSIDAGTTVVYNTAVEDFTVTADEGYEIVSVTANNGVTVTENSDGTYSTSAITADTQITVTTRQIVVAVSVEVESEDGVRLTTLCIPAADYTYGQAYTFALHSGEWIYSRDSGATRFSVGEEQELTVAGETVLQNTDGEWVMVINVVAYPATYGDASALLNGLVARYNALMAGGLIADELDDAQALLEDMNDVSQDVIDMATEEEQAAFNGAKTDLEDAIDELRQQIADDEQAAEDAEILRKATLESVVVKGIEVAMDDDQTGNDGMAQTSAYTYTLTLTESELADLRDTTSLSIVVTPRNEDHAVTITTTQGAAWDLEATTIDRGYYWYVICNNVYFDVIVEVVADPDPEPTEVEQALAAAAAIEEVTVDNYDEAKELCDVTLENLINAGSTTADEKADLEEAQTALAGKIEAYETIRDNLETAQTNALAELAAYYNTMQPAEVEAARGAYLAAMDAINGAADPDAVDDALAAGIADMADAAGVEAVDKADALLNAGVVLDEVVAILLDDLTDENGNLPDDESVKTIGDTLWEATSSDDIKLGDGQVIPALVANEIPVDRIYADYLADGSKTVEGITAALANTDTEILPSETIVDAYVNYWLSIGDTEEGNGLTDVIVEAGDLEDDRSRDFIVTLTSEEYDIDGTGLAKMVNSSGVDVEDITIWRSTDNWTASEADSLSEFIAMVKPDSDGNIPEDGMVARVIAGTDYYLEITIGEMTYHVTLTYEAAEEDVTE